NKKLVELSTILRDQLDVAEGNLKRAEGALEDFRVKTITLPSEKSSTPVAAGLEVTRQPVLNSFFDMKIQRGQLRRDREALENALAVRSDTSSWVSELTLIEPVRQATDLAKVLDEFTSKQAELRALLYRYTDQTPAVQRLKSDVATLRTVTIPSLAQ